MSQPQTFPLWPGEVPGAKGKRPEDIPTLTSYLPPAGKKPTAAVVIFPGGGYVNLMMVKEGSDFALWLNERGIAAFVLKYRLSSGGYHYPEISNDAARAIRHIRAHAADWNIDPEKIGVMGSSAGGHLVSYCVTHFDAGNSRAADPVERSGSRPDFGILCYPVISFARESQTRTHFLGEKLSPKLIKLTSSEGNVTPETPPCFILHTANDQIVSAEHPLIFALALQKHKVSYALHLYPDGFHGIGLGVEGYIPGTGQKLHPWTVELALWLSEQKLSV